MRIRRLQYGVVTDDDEILVGEKVYMRFVPFGEVTQRDKIVLYESLKKAQAALNSSWYFESAVRGKAFRIIPVEETLVDWISE